MCSETALRRGENPCDAQETRAGEEHDRGGRATAADVGGVKHRIPRRVVFGGEYLAGLRRMRIGLVHGWGA